MALALKNKPPVVIPKAALRRAGFKSGQELEVKVSGGVISIDPKVPVAAGEYTAAQRQVIDARLAEARKGPYHGPFEAANEAIEFLRRELRNRKAVKRKTR